MIEQPIVPVLIQIFQNMSHALRVPLSYSSYLGCNCTICSTSVHTLHCIVIKSPQNMHVSTKIVFLILLIHLALVSYVRRCYITHVAIAILSNF